MTEVVCDNKRLIYSNRICCISKESLEVKVDFGEDVILDIIFKFHNDGKEIGTTVRGVDDKTIEFNLFNYNSSLGSGLNDAYEVGKIGDDSVYVIFYVYRLQDNAFPIVDISVYKEI